MKLASARPSRAPIPRRIGKPEPVTLAPVARSRMPSASPRSQCGFGVKSNFGMSPQRTYNTVGAGVPFGHVGQEEIGNGEQLRLERVIHDAQVGIERLHRVRRYLERCEEIVGRRTRALPLCHFLRGRVALGLERLDTHEDFTPPPVEVEDPVERRGGRRIEPTCQGGPGSVGILAQSLDVDHVSSSAIPARDPDIRSCCPPGSGT